MNQVAVRGPTIKHESRAYFKALGKHITLLRKSRGMTQAELARAIGVSQQAVFAYELGERRRVSVLILVRVAAVFSIPVEELVGITKPVRVPKGRLSPRALRHAERLQGLSRTSQRFVVRIIDMLEKWKYPGSAKARRRRESVGDEDPRQIGASHD